MLQYEPTPVVALNRAEALAETGQKHAALAQMSGLADALDGYQPFHAAHADVLAATGSIVESLNAFRRAIKGAASSSDAVFLAKRRDKLLKLQATP